jgi:hypothetical protein
MKLTHLLIVVTFLCFPLSLVAFVDERPQESNPELSKDNLRAAAPTKPSVRTGVSPAKPGPAATVTNPGASFYRNQFKRKPGSERASGPYQPISRNAGLPVNAWQRHAPAMIGGPHSPAGKNAAAINGTQLRRKQ